MTLLLVLAGLILLLAGGSWFAGATTVGVILLVVGVIGVVIQVAVAAVAASTINKARRRF